MGDKVLILDGVTGLPISPAVAGAAIPAGSNLIGKVGLDQTTPGTTNAISMAQIGANAVSVNNGAAGTGTQRVTIASDSTGQVAISQATPGATNAVQIVPAYKAAKSAIHGNSAASTNATLQGSGTKMVFGVDVANNHATNWAYLKVYNKGTTPTVGTDIPVLVIPIAPNSARFLPDTIGKAFASGIGTAITGGAADTDVAAVLAGQVQFMIEYL